MKKKLLALLLCVGMLAEAAIPLFANDTNEITVESNYEEEITVETDSEETNTHDFLIPVEQKTEVPEGYIGIYTAEDLDNVRNDLDANYILMNDIDLSVYENWEPIGNYSRSFNGKFDGNGFRILTYTQTIFSTLVGSSISNLIIECDSIYKNIEDLYKIGVLSSTSSGTIFDNVVCKGTVDIQYDNFSYSSRELMVGGFVAESTGDEFNSCSSSIAMNVYVASELNFMSLKVGGFTGETKNTEYYNSKNFGNIIVSGVIMIGDNGDYSTYVGGITGYVYSSTIMSNCINYGIIKNFKGIIGGLIGILGNVRSTDKVSSKISNISHCMNYGSITVDSSYDTNVGYHQGCTAGGIVGCSTFSSDISYCTNRGNISGAVCSGGIVGVSYETKITNNINYGNVEYEGSYSDEVVYASLAGIAGRAGDGEILYCSNFGSIKTVAYGEAYSGGIVGNFVRNYIETISHCFNEGEIIAMSMHSLSPINLLWIESSTFAAGIAAAAPYNISNCYNTGRISSVNMSNDESEYASAGGIVSDAQYHSTNLDCVYNIGVISSNAQFGTVCSGGIIGLLTGTSDMSTLTSCYTITGIDIISPESKSPYELIMCAALSDTEMQDASSFVGFDFDTVWEIGVTEGYPYPTLRNNPHSGGNKPTPSEDVLVGKTFTQSTLRALGYDTIPADYAVSEYPPFLQFTNENSGIFYIVNSEFGYPVNFTYNLAGDLITITPSDTGDYAEGSFGQATELVMQMTEDGNLKVKSYSPEPTETNNYAIGWTTYDDIFLLKNIPSVKPTVSNMPADYQINLGESFDLSNVTVTAGNDGRLSKVTLKHNLTGTTFVPSSILVAYQSSSITLGDNFVLSGDNYPLNTVGTHEFIIYASADNYTVTDNAVATFTVTVVEATDGAINAYVICTDPEDYAGNYRDFTVYFDSLPSSAYLQFDNQHNPKKWLSDEYCSTNPAFIIDTTKLIETSDGYQYETTFIIHSEGLARNDYARKVRVAVPTVDGVKYSEPFTFYVNPIPEHPQNTIGIAYEQTLDISDDTELPAITAVIANRKVDNNNQKYYRLTVANYSYDDNASIFFYWKAESGEFQRVNDDYTVVDFIPDGENKVTVYMGDGLGYVASYTLTINN